MLLEKCLAVLIYDFLNFLKRFPIHAHEDNLSKWLSVLRSLNFK